MAPVEFVVESVKNLPRGKALTCGVLGDVNNDGQVDLADALLVVVFNLDPSIIAPNNGNMGLGDVTDDGTVNLADLLAIMTYVINPSDTSLPTGIGQAATRVNWVAGPIRRLANDAGVAIGTNVWSPSGRYIYFNAGIDGDSGIYWVATEADWYGSYEVVQVVKHSANLVWSPDARYLAYDSERDGNRDIYLYDRETETEHRLTNNDGYDANPTWSPDGSQIAFQSNRAGDWDIYVMDADGSNPRWLAYTHNYEGFPAWSPDGQKIAFVSNRAGNDDNLDIYVMDILGSCE